MPARPIIAPKENNGAKFWLCVAICVPFWTLTAIAIRHMEKTKEDHTTFVPNSGIADGIAVVTDDQGILWAGSIKAVPLGSVPAGAHINVNPNLMERIRQHAEQREPGGVGSLDGVR